MSEGKQCDSLMLCLTYFLTYLFNLDTESAVLHGQAWPESTLHMSHCVKLEKSQTYSSLLPGIHWAESASWLLPLGQCNLPCVFLSKQTNQGRKKEFKCQVHKGMLNIWVDRFSLIGHYTIYTWIKTSYSTQLTCIQSGKFFKNNWEEKGLMS